MEALAEKKNIIHLSGNTLDGTICTIFSKYINQIFGEYETNDHERYNIKTFTVDTTTLDGIISNMEVICHPMSIELYDMIIITGISLPDYLIQKYHLNEMANLYYFADCELSISAPYSSMDIGTNLSNHWFTHNDLLENKRPLSAFSLYYEWWLDRINTDNIQEFNIAVEMNAYRDVADSLGTWEYVQNGNCQSYLLNRCIYTLFQSFKPAKFEELFTSVIIEYIKDFEDNTTNSMNVSGFIRELSLKAQDLCDDAMNNVSTKTYSSETFMLENARYKIDYIFGFVFSDEFPDMIGESMLALFKDIDISVVVSDNIMRFYTNDISINIGEFITIFGGIGNARQGIVKINHSDMTWINMAKFNAMINRAGNLPLKVIE